MQARCLLTAWVFTLSEARPFFRDPQPLFRDPKTTLTKLASLALVMPCCFAHNWEFDRWCMNIAEEFSKPTWHFVEQYGCHGSGQCWFGEHIPQWQVNVPLLISKPCRASINCYSFLCISLVFCILSCLLSLMCLTVMICVEGIKAIQLLPMYLHWNGHSCILWHK